MTRRFLVPVQTDNVDFNASPVAAAAPRRLRWNNGDSTLEFGANTNVSIQIGQEQVVLCYNDTASTITNGQVVYLSGAQGQRPAVRLAQANTEATSIETFGIATENIAAGAEGFVTTFGKVNDFNTSSFAEGAVLWLSPTVAGGLTATKPSAPNHLVQIGYVVKSHASSGQIFVKIQNGYELDELHNVLITSPTNGQVLTYNSASAIWTNQSASGGGGGSSVTVSDTAPLSPNQGDLWFNSTDLNTYVYYDSSWVEASGGGNTTASLWVGETPDGNPEQGDLWFNSSNAKTYVFYDSSWVEIGGGMNAPTSIDGGEPASIFVESIDGGSF